MESNQPSNQPQTSTKQRSTAAIIGILVGIAAVLLVVNAALKKNDDKVLSNQNTNVVANVNTSTNTNQPEVITSNIDISDWKTYRNTKYEFLLKLPEELKNVNPSDAAFQEGEIPFGTGDRTYWFIWSPDKIFTSTVNGIMKVDLDFLSPDELGFKKDIKIEYADITIKTKDYKRVSARDGLEIYQPVAQSGDECSNYVIQNSSAIALVQFCSLEQPIISNILREFSSLRNSG